MTTYYVQIPVTTTVHTKVVAPEGLSDADVIKQVDIQDIEDLELEVDTVLLSLKHAVDTTHEGILVETD